MLERLATFTHIHRHWLAHPKGGAVGVGSDHDTARLLAMGLMVFEHYGIPEMNVWAGMQRPKD